jgi:hypothetical protein
MQEEALLKADLNSSFGKLLCGCESLVCSTAHFAVNKCIVNPYYEQMLDNLRIAQSNKNPLQQGWRRAAYR